MSNLNVASTRTRSKSPAKSAIHASTPVDSSHCSRCGDFMYKLECFGPIMNKCYHKTCFKCLVCDTQLDLKNYHTNTNDLKDKNVYCKAHAPKSNGYLMTVPSSKKRPSISSLDNIDDSDQTFVLGNEKDNIGWNIDKNGNLKFDKPGWNSNIIIDGSTKIDISEKDPNEIKIDNQNSINPIIEKIVNKLKNLSEEFDDKPQTNVQHIDIVIESAIEEDKKLKDEPQSYTEENIIDPIIIPIINEIPDKDSIEKTRDEPKEESNISELNKLVDKIVHPIITIEEIETQEIDISANNSFDSEKPQSSELDKVLDDLFQPKSVETKEKDVDVSPTPSKREIDSIIGSNCNLGMIRLSLNYETSSRKLIVIVHEARNLKNTDKKGLSDPYARIYLLPDPKKQTKKKTRIIKNNLYPIWNEKFEYQITLNEMKNKTLYVNLKDDKGIFESQESTFIGELLIKLDSIDLENGSYNKKWYYLQDETKDIFD